MRIVFSIVALACCALFQPAQGAEQSPHAQALVLVFETQSEEIDRIELEHGGVIHSGERDWWFDTDERHWNVWRPVEPGTIDSTHLFVVEYRIKDRPVALWTVDTQKRTVTKSKKAEPGATDNPDDAQRLREDH